MKLEDNEGFPWTASTHFGWMLLVFIVTAGLSILALGIYLSLWIRSKGRSELPLLAFFLLTLCTLFCGLLDNWLPTSHIAELAVIVAAFLYVASAFLLRREVIAHFRESQGWKPVINPVLALGFSALYVNYCLVPDRVSQSATITSLDISHSSDSAKIAK